MSTVLLAARPARIAAAQDPVAEFRGVSKTYFDPIFHRPRIQAVRDVSFRLEPGRALALLGPNRAGKTTLVKTLLTLCRATCGEIIRLGRPVGDRSTLAQVGYVHEHQAFPRYLTAHALLEFYGALTVLPQETLRQRIPPLIERFGLADRAREPIARFSKGMLQRLAMAQALLNQPRLLVLDEPTEGLDLAGRQLLREAVAETCRRGGSVLLVSHVLPEVEQVCDEAAVLVEGRLVYHGRMADLLEGRPLETALAELYARRQPA